jgi:muramidase (phage lysozyme)
MSDTKSTNEKDNLRRARKFQELEAQDQLSVLMFVSLALQNDPALPENEEFTKRARDIMGFETTEQYEQWWHENAQPSVDNNGSRSTSYNAPSAGWKDNIDFSKFDFEGSDNALLELIGQKEANGNYNLAYGGKQVNFTDMSINEVLRWQDNYVAGGSPSSAAGKYQFIRGTLRSLKSELGLSGEEKFSPEMQDKLAEALLERRGYSDYLEGNISEDKFMNNLSKEWASLPKDGSGRSYYAGDGLNKAGVSPETLLAAIRSVKEPKEQMVASNESAGTSVAKDNNDGINSSINVKEAFVASVENKPQPAASPPSPEPQETPAVAAVNKPDALTYG